MEKEEGAKRKRRRKGTADGQAETPSFNAGGHENALPDSEAEACVLQAPEYVYRVCTPYSLSIIAITLFIEEPCNTASKELSIEQEDQEKKEKKIKKFVVPDGRR